MLINLPIYRKLHDLQERFPATKLITVPLRKAIMAADLALAAMLLVGWILLIGIPTRCGLLFRQKRPTGDAEICFLSQEGFAVAPTRVRTYSFAGRVAAHGIRTRVLAFWDDLFRFQGLPPRTVLLTECVFIALIAAHRLLRNPPTVIVQQRPRYDVITTAAIWWLRGTPIVFDIDDWILEDYVFSPPLRVRHLLAVTGRIACGCVVSSTPLEREMRKRFRRLVKIPTFVDVEKFYPRRATSAGDFVVFGWNGTLFEEFMVEALLVMIRAFAGACDQLGSRADIRLEIAGAGGQLSKVEKLISGEFRAYPIRLMGWLDPRTMNEYLDGVDVGLYSLPGADVKMSARDALFIPAKSPTKVFEYMAKGIPTIATGIGEVANFIENGVTGYCTDDPGELIDAFVSLAVDPQLRRRMGDNSRRLCTESYSLDIAGMMYAQFVSEVGGLPSLVGGEDSGFIHGTAAQSASSGGVHD